MNIKIIENATFTSLNHKKVSHKRPNSTNQVKLFVRFNRVFVITKFIVTVCFIIPWEHNFNMKYLKEQTKLANANVLGISLINSIEILTNFNDVSSFFIGFNLMRLFNLTNRRFSFSSNTNYVKVFHNCWAVGICLFALHVKQELYNCSQFHQHLKSNFCANILLPLSYKAKL